MRLTGKVAVITGAAGGIGKETSLLFAKHGAKLILADMNEEGVQAVAQEIQQAGGEAIGIQHDVTSEESWAKVTQAAIDQFGTVDILFNNAGLYLIKPLEETTVEDCKRILNVNVIGVFLGMKHIIPIMAKKKSGSIINTSSTSGLKGHPGESIYGASKSAVYNLTQNVAMEYAATNVRVNAVCPGFINTAMATYAAGLSNTSLDDLGKSYHAFARMGEPRDIANMVLFLASDESTFITGGKYIVDGGATVK